MCCEGLGLFEVVDTAAVAREIFFLQGEDLMNWSKKSTCTVQGVEGREQEEEGEED